ncbi:MAG: ATP-binding protein [Bdellovibrionales bacterium]
MNKESQNNIRRPILGYKLLGYILLCSSLVTIVATFVQLWGNYSRGIKQVSSQVEKIKLTHLNSLSKSLWIFDTTQLKIEMEGILNYPDVNFVEIQSNSGNSIRVGKKNSEAPLKHTIPLVFNSKNTELNLGVLYIEANYKSIYNELKSQIWIIAGSQAAKTFIISFLILLIIQQLVTKRLEKILRFVDTAELKDLPTERLNTKLKYSDSDELDYLSHSINAMIEKQQDAYRALSTEMEDRKKFQEDLYQKSSILENVINGMPGFIYWRDEKGRFLGTNDLYSEFIGLGVKQVIGKDLTELVILKEELKNFHQLDDLVRNTGRPIWNQNIELHQRNGDIAHYVQSIVPMFCSKGLVRGVLGLFVDISDKKQFETEKEQMREQILRSAKMASIGELAAGVGHEINNPLAIIQGNLELLSYHIEDLGSLDQEAESMIQSQMTAINRIRAIVDGLRVFARKEDDDNQLADLNLAIKDTYRLISKVYGAEGVDLEMEMHANDTFVLCNTDKIQQAILNIVSNAKDALMASENSTKKIKMKTYTSDNDFVIEISDNGTGIPSDILPKIFDGYFTTKPSGQGTGIGLDITKKIIEASGGEIKVDTEIGTGTTFRLLLPSVEKIAQRTTRDLDAGFSGHCLVVDDDEHIIEILAKHLRSLGFTVDSTQCPLQAIEMMKKSNYQLLLTDMKMPEMSGLELMTKASELSSFPKYKILATGGDDDTIDLNEQLQGKLEIDLVLNKPFSKKELEKKLKYLLSS